MKNRIVIATVWIASLALASTGSAIATQQITGGSIANGTLTGVDLKNGTVAAGDLAAPVRAELRDPVIVHDTVPAGDRVAGEVAFLDVDCPAGMVAVNGGIEQDDTGREGLAEWSGLPVDGGWRVGYFAADTTTPVRVFAACV